jgi:hypothetical protein
MKRFINSTIIVFCWLSCAGISFASYGGELIGVDYPSTIQPGQDLTIHVTVLNTGSSQWYGGSRVSWICDLEWKEGANTITLSNYMYSVIPSGATDATDIILVSSIESGASRRI